MSKSRLTGRIFSVAFIIALPTASVCVFSLGVAAEPEKDEAVFPVAALQKAAGRARPFRRQYLGFQSCLRCHNSGVQGVSVPLPGGGTLNLADDQWVLYREYPVWVRDDKHGQAYTVLLNDRSKEMGRILGIQEIHRDKRCLACHTGFPIHSMPVVDDGLVAKDLQTKLDVNLGVSCEGCHGPAGDAREEDQVLAEGWMGPHQIQPVTPYEKTNPWRFRTPQSKYEKYGFSDVRTPTSKARICASCHIGNTKDGKVVTHEMYAAGHPPLPGFEIETFVYQMPKHWREFAEKSDKVRNQFLKYSKDSLYDEQTYKSENLHRTKSMLVGALVSVSEFLKLTAQLADDDVDSPVTKPQWPELAQFECFACHHDLKHPAWRQKRKSPVGTPGRPPLREWTTVLAKLALRISDGDDSEFDRQMNFVRQAIDVQPFGRKNELTSSAYSVAEWTWAKAEEIQKKSFSRDDGNRILKEIAETAVSEVFDYDSARQLVWAFQIVHDELTGEEHNGEIEKILNLFKEEMLLLNLRSGRKSTTAILGEAAPRKILEVDLTLSLPLVASYEPEEFQKRFAEIQRLLENKE